MENPRFLAHKRNQQDPVSRRRRITMGVKKKISVNQVRKKQNYMMELSNVHTKLMSLIARAWRAI